jgi:hypothetical protein
MIFRLPLLLCTWWIQPQSWFQTYKHSPGAHTWEHFVVVVSRKFVVNTHREKTIELLNLCQSRSVEEYKHQFDGLVYQILLYDHNISEMMLVSQILLGLKEELSHSIEMHLPCHKQQYWPLSRNILMKVQTSHEEEFWQI